MLVFYLLIRWKDMSCILVSENLDKCVYTRVTGLYTSDKGSRHTIYSLYYHNLLEAGVEIYQEKSGVNLNWYKLC